MKIFSNKTHQCEYANLWKGLAEKYDLDLDQRDANTLKKIEEDCGTDGLIPEDQRPA